MEFTKNIRTTKFAKYLTHFFLKVSKLYLTKLLEFFENVNRDNAVYIVYLDFQKAFDIAFES